MAQDGPTFFRSRESLALAEQGVTTQYSSTYHTPVLVREVLEYLQVGPGKVYLDGTLGGGGHTQAILDASTPDGRVVALDRDPQAHAVAGERLNAYMSRLELVVANYGDCAQIAATHGKFDGFLVDAGVSSKQLDDPARGFSFRNAGPLDMRMGPDAARLDQWLEEVSEETLADVLFQYGEIRASRRTAKAIKEAVLAGSLETTTDLARIVESVLGTGGGAGRRTHIHPATLVFQALRIAVNEELQSLERAVTSILDVVKPGGRVVFISFHSLEDRVVKAGFRKLAGQIEEPDPVLRRLGLGEVTPARVQILTRKPVEAKDDELQVNPRARSARLRAVEVL